MSEIRPEYLVFFDVDHTLMRGSTGNAFSSQSLKMGILGVSDLARIMVWSVLYKAGRIGEKEMWEKSIDRLSGQDEAILCQACEISFNRTVRHRIYREALRELRSHRLHGGLPAIISGGPRHSVMLLARALSVTEMATTWPNVVDGKISDLRGVEIMMGEAKTRAARRLCDKYGVDLARCWAYGDSNSDVHLLGSVGHPVAVNPKPGLRALAREKGWQVARWREVTTIDYVTLVQVDGFRAPRE